MEIKEFDLNRSLRDHSDARNFCLGFYFARYLRTQDEFPQSHEDLYRVAEREYEAVVLAQDPAKTLFSAREIHYIAEQMRAMKLDFDKNRKSVSDSFFFHPDRGKRILAVFPKWKTVINDIIRDYLLVQGSSDQSSQRVKHPNKKNAWANQCTFILSAKYECIVSDHNRIIYKEILNLRVGDRDSVINQSVMKNNTAQAKSYLITPN
jgi:hypothetical protein